MKYKYNVITPLSRYENLSKLIKMLEPFRIQWHVITDADVPFRLEFDQRWITHYICDNKEVAFYNRCNAAINWMLDVYPQMPKERYCILNDDDAYEPGFFEKVDAVDGELLIVSLDRGHHTPAGVSPERAHGIDTLVAAPENMHPGQVSVEQFIASGRIQSVCRLPLHISGDGQMIEWMVNHYPAAYVPEAKVWFNYYEPGRWT